MQTLDVISINLWQMLASLCNLLILFFILKRFLYQPVRKMLAQRKAMLDEQYEKAQTAQTEAEASRQAYAAQSYCAAYVVAQKFGLDTSGFKFDKVCESWAGKEPQEQRTFLSDVKRAAYSINREVQRSFRDMDQVIQPDGFEIGKGAQAKAEKAEKATESR